MGYLARKYRPRIRIITGPGCRKDERMDDGGHAESFSIRAAANAEGKGEKERRECVY